MIVFGTCDIFVVFCFNAFNLVFFPKPEFGELVISLFLQPVFLRYKLVIGPLLECGEGALELMQQISVKTIPFVMKRKLKLGNA